MNATLIQMSLVAAWIGTYFVGYWRGLNHGERTA
jgi:hypothetical protein